MHAVWGKLLSSAFSAFVLSMTADRRIAFMLRQAGQALVAWVLALVSAVVGLLFLLLAVFFALADISNFTEPALFTGAVSLIAALLFGFWGVQIIRRR